MRFSLLILVDILIIRIVMFPDTKRAAVQNSRENREERRCSIPRTASEGRDLFPSALSQVQPLFEYENRFADNADSAE